MSIKITDYVKIPDYSAMPLPPNMVDIALPKHLWGKLHDDWPIKKDTPRGETADGPRAIRAQGTEWAKKYIPTPPRLVKGYGIARWMAVADQSVLYIPMFDSTKMYTEDDIPEIVDAIERKPKTPLFEQSIKIRKKTLLQFYGPSSIQKFTKKSYLERDPYHVSGHRMIKKRERYDRPKNDTAEFGKGTGADTVWFWRYGSRWDSLDDYYNQRSAFGKSAYAGFRWN